MRRRRTIRWRGLLAALGLCCVTGSGPSVTAASAQMPLPVQIEKQREARRVLNLDFTRNIDPRVNFRRAGPSADWVCAPPRLANYATNAPTWPVCDPVTGANRGIGLWGQSQVATRWSSDLTNSYWIKTNINPLLITGVDGTANSASRISATAADATVCNSVPINATYQKIASAYVRRSSGTGPVWMSSDSGTTWVEITNQINSIAWHRVPSGGLYQRVANAAICFKLSTSGDAIDVDRVNLAMEVNANKYTEPSPPLVNTGSGNTFRFADLAWMDLTQVPGFDSDSFSVIIKVRLPVYIYPWPAGNARRGFMQIDDGAGTNSLMFNYQADVVAPGLNCNPNPALPATIWCATLDVDKWINNSYSSGSAVSVRCSYPGGGIIYVPPLGDTNGVIAYSYKSGAFVAITCNNGGPPQVLSDGSFYPGGNVQRPVIGILSPTKPTGTFKRMVLGSAPAESHGLSGSVTVGDVLTDVVTWESPPGTPNTATATYTFVGGDTLATGLANLVNAINSNTSFSSQGISVSIGVDGQIWPKHPLNIFPTWTFSVTGAKTEIAINNNVTGISGPGFSYIYSVQVFSPAVAPYALASLIPLSFPDTVSPSAIALQKGGHALYRTNSAIGCNRC